MKCIKLDIYKVQYILSRICVEKSFIRYIIFKLYKNIIFKNYLIGKRKYYKKMGNNQNDSLLYLQGWKNYCFIFLGYFG